jgi:hypothetical protein
MQISNNYEILIYIVVVVFLFCRCKSMKKEYMADLCENTYCNKDGPVEMNLKYSQPNGSQPTNTQPNGSQPTNTQPNSTPQKIEMQPPLSTIKSNIKNINTLKKINQ